MDETELREQLRDVLDGVAPPADLHDRAMRQLGPRRRATRRTARLGVAVLLAAALIVALMVASRGSHQSVRVVETTISPDIAATTSIDPILDLLDRPDGLTYGNAIQTSVAGCMQSKGWVYVPWTGNPAKDHGAGTGPTDPQALLSYREHYGYGYLNPTPSDSEALARVNLVNERYFQSLAPEARLRYTRDLGSGPDERYLSTTTAPNSGCRGVAETAERRIIPRIPQAMVHELGTRQNGVFADPAYLAAQRHWSVCMLQTGFHFQHASDAQGSISNLFAPPPNDPHSPASAQAQANARALARAAALEVRTASADARCAGPTVWPVQRRLELTILQDVIDRYGRNVICGASCRSALQGTP